ncbi:MAG: TetR/AcrR family transcriptional regulator [Pseudomonadales bacterium]|nr:TetR/AcrR family transcriptional regulator [Pseudomonadales bacterium]
MPSQKQRRESTRARIIEVAKNVFARDGYAKASLAEIVNEAGVTTGAIYHHFGDKKGLFVAVAEYLEQQIVVESGAIPNTSKSIWQRFENNILKTLEICAREDIQRIVFRDAPTVVGFYEWKEIEIKYGFGQLQNAISKLSKEGLIETSDPDLTAHVLLGAIMQAAHYTAMSKNKKKALKESQDTLRKILRSIRIRTNKN